MMIRCCLLEVLARTRDQQRPDFIYKFLDVFEGICFLCVLHFVPYSSYLFIPSLAWCMVVRIYVGRVAIFY